MNIKINSYSPPPDTDPDLSAAFTATIDVNRDVSIRILHGEHRKNAARQPISLGLIKYETPKNMEPGDILTEVINAILLAEMERSLASG